MNTDSSKTKVELLREIQDLRNEVKALRTQTAVLQRSTERVDLSLSGAFFENIINILPIEVAVMDAEGRFLFINPIGVPDPELRQWLIGKTVLDYARYRNLDDTPFRARRAWEKEVICSKQISHHDEVLRDRHSGEKRYLRRVMHPILNADGTIDHIMAYGIDLTEDKKVEQALIDAKEEAEKMARLKSTFLANMSHEIRTPLTAILGFSSILTDEVPPEHREFTELIARSAHRLMDTINSVLDLSMLESSSLHVQLEPLNVSHEVAAKAELLRPLAAQKGLQIDIVPPPQEVWAMLDASVLDRILNNLLGNAIKFTEEGYVQVACKPQDEHLLIEITDTGIGIDEIFLPHIFDAFTQESGGLDRSHEGSGLGLSITKRLVMLMHGTLSVHSKKGEGSTFSIQLPRIPPP